MFHQRLQETLSLCTSAWEWFEIAQTSENGDTLSGTTFQCIRVMRNDVK